MLFDATQETSHDEDHDVMFLSNYISILYKYYLIIKYSILSNFDHKLVI